MKSLRIKRRLEKYSSAIKAKALVRMVAKPNSRGARNFTLQKVESAVAYRIFQDVGVKAASEAPFRIYIYCTRYRSSSSIFYEASRSRYSHLYKAIDGVLVVALYRRSTSSGSVELLQS